jgi:hypothetical protein
MVRDPLPPPSERAGMVVPEIGSVAPPAEFQFCSTIFTLEAETPLTTAM